MTSAPRPQLPDAELCSLMVGKDAWTFTAIPAWGVSEISVADGPHGVRKVESPSMLDAQQSVPATCFPTASALGASWDTDLVAEVGVALAREASAAGVDVLLGPGVNMKRHPLSGRNFEYFSEDPLLSGRLAAAYIEAVQAQGVGTSIKHYAVNNHEFHRMVSDVVVDERTLREIYLRAFEIAVTEARPWTVMCAYNLVNGIYCAEHTELMTTILRDEWGFDGLVMTDWGANNDRVAGVVAGVDVEMPGGSKASIATLEAALAGGRLERSALETSAGRIADLDERCRSARGAARLSGAEVDAHHALARRAAAASCVLLTNDGTLPIVAGSSVALVGGFATAPRYQGEGSSRVNAFRVDTLDAELRALGAEHDVTVRYAAGYESSSAIDQSLIDEAVALAAECDVAVVHVGLPPAMESEGFDRDHLRLPRQHDALVAAVAAVNPRTVVVLSNGAPVEMPWVGDVAAILEGYLGGGAGGGGLADVLLGVAEPGGRLAETFPVSVGDVASDPWFPGEPRRSQYREGLFVGYRWFESAGVEPLFPFGHGLSYTSFDLSAQRVPVAAFDADAGPIPAVEVEVDVRNIGERPGSTVVQWYVDGPEVPGASGPRRQLAAFAKVHLGPGETTTARATIDPRSFAQWHVGSRAWRVLGGEYRVVAGCSVRDDRCETTIAISSTFAPDIDAARLFPRQPAVPLVVTAAEFEERLGHPIPPALPVMPFHENSTLGELRATPVGRVLSNLMVAGGKFSVRKEDPDGGLAVMIHRAILELPVRNLVAMSGGLVSPKVVAGLLRLANRGSSRMSR